jgi:cytochrome c biogenesis factor
MFSATATAAALESAAATLATLGQMIVPVLLALAASTVLAAIVPTLRRWLPAALGLLVGALALGEAAFVWFHLRLWQLCQVVDPATGQVTGSFAVPLWIESEKLYVWAFILAVIALVVRRQRAELQPALAVTAAALTIGALLWSRPFAEPLPSFLGGYQGYLAAWASGDPGAMMGAFQSMEGSRRFFYNTWYMWVHPPLLFISYGAFVASFAATVLMIMRRHSSYEQTAYRWARFGYLPLTFGMLIGFPWAIMAWQGESWWWSGKVNMSIMMWVLYTAYLHARLYLRHKGMWRVVAALAVLSFVALVLTYITTYVVPGAHSVV